MLPKRFEILPYAQLSRYIIAIKQNCKTTVFAVVVIKQRVQPTFSKKFIYFIYLFYLFILFISKNELDVHKNTVTARCASRDTLSRPVGQLERK